MGLHIGATGRIRLNLPCAAAIRPHVKLLISFHAPQMVATKYATENDLTKKEKQTSTSFVVVC